MIRTLTVRLDDRDVGRLTEADGVMSFAYDDQWRADADAPPLSIAMPPPGPYDDAACRAFFGGLLPEGAVREHVARRFGVSAGNEFSMLEAIGRDCAGAVSLWPPDEAAHSGHESTYDWLDDDGLAAAIADLPERPLGIDPVGEIRLSLAGAQDKLPVFIDRDGRVGLPRGRSPSSHIIKAPLRQADSVLNEALCLGLAAELGLVAARVEPRTVAGQEFLLVERYDRRQREGRLIRVHQEDFAQALSVPSSSKYESEGGPGAVACIELLRRCSSQPALDVLAFADALVLNVLVGNADAHSKNFSLLLDDDGPRLAPLYDILCTRCYTGLSRRMAMKIGGQDKAEWLSERNWDTFATEAGLGAAAFKRRRVRLAERAVSAIGRVADRLVVSGWNRPVLAAVGAEVARRSRQLIGDPSI